MYVLLPSHRSDKLFQHRWTVRDIHFACQASQNDSPWPLGTLTLYKCFQRHQFSLLINCLITFQLSLFGMMAYWPRGQVSQLVSENSLLILCHSNVMNLPTLAFHSVICTTWTLCSCRLYTIYNQVTWACFYYRHCWPITNTSYCKTIYLSSTTNRSLNNDSINASTVFFPGFFSKTWTSLTFRPMYEIALVWYCNA